MAVKIYKLEDGAVRTTYVEPHDLHNHLENGWTVESPKTEEGQLKEDSPLKSIEVSRDLEMKREKLTLSPGNKLR